ncbi:hypothetical protein [Microbispora sp. H13382]|uniref:hypothetical protein n=1 Tax=Microbispora sp. H13382 TaxID=2729112 RepID=UPI0016047846|nr:hypothetical protein [Microbispora sp. H13382]
MPRAGSSPSRRSSAWRCQSTAACDSTRRSTHTPASYSSSRARKELTVHNRRAQGVAALVKSSSRVVTCRE